MVHIYIAKVIIFFAFMTHTDRPHFALRERTLKNHLNAVITLAKLKLFHSL